MATSTSTTLDDSLPVAKAKAVLTLKQTGVTSRYMQNITLGKGKGGSYREPVISTFSVIGLTEGTDMSQNQTVSDSLVTVTTAEAGGQVVITDVAVDDLNDDIMRLIGEGLANAYMNRVDNDLTSLFSGLDAGYGGATTTFVAGWIAAAHARLLNATRPTIGKLVTVVHPYQFYDVASDIAALNAGTWRKITGTPSVGDVPGGSIAGLTQEVWEKYLVNQLFGMDIVVDPTISVSSSASYGAVFAERAMIYLKYKAPEMEPERDASLRATELNYVGRYGKGERDGTWGFYLHSETSAPLT